MLPAIAATMDVFLARGRTRDLDVLVEPSEANPQKVSAAFLDEVASNVRPRSRRKSSRTR